MRRVRARLQPDVIIGLTVLAYRYEGLRRSDFGLTLLLLRKTMESEMGPELRRPASAAWIQWVQAAGSFVRGTKRLAASVRYVHRYRCPNPRPLRHLKSGRVLKHDFFVTCIRTVS